MLTYIYIYQECWVSFLNPTYSGNLFNYQTQVRNSRILYLSLSEQDCVHHTRIRYFYGFCYQSGLETLRQIIGSNLG